MLITGAAIAVAQTPRRRTGPAAPKPTPTPITTPAPVSSHPQQPADPAPAPLAIVNDTGITLAPTPGSQSVYEKIGVKHVINATGTVTTLGGSLMPPEVVAAWSNAEPRNARANFARRNARRP